MQYIGKLNKNIIGEYKNKIITDDVFISEERIYHIKEHHPELSNKELKYMKSVINDPDYIFNDRKNKDTILYVKNIMENFKNYRMVVKLNTNKEEKSKANTIISLWNIGNKKLGQFIRNEQIIFQKLDKKV